MVIMLFNLCNNPVREILLPSSSTDKDIKKFAKVTKHINGGDLNVSSLIKDPALNNTLLMKGKGQKTKAMVTQRWGKY